MRALQDGVGAPAVTRPPDAREEIERVGIASEAGRLRAVLLRRELERLAARVALSVEAPIEVGLLVAGVDVGARVRRGTLHAPGAEMNAHLCRVALDRNVFERPQRNVAQLRDTVRARIERIELQPVEEDANAAHVSQIGGFHGHADPARAIARDAGNAVEEIEQGERAAGEQLVAAPPELGPDVGEHRRLGAREGCLDRIGRWHVDRNRTRLRSSRSGIDANGIGARRDWDRARDGVALRAGGVGHGLLGARRAGPGAHCGGEQNGPGQKTGAGSTRRQAALGQPALPRTNSTNMPTGTPVGPRGIDTRSLSE